MGDSVFIPSLIVVTLALATVTQLVDLAETSSQKAVKYADDMTAALDCAYQARPLSDCSPDLFSADFKEEMDRTQAMLAQAQKEIDDQIEP